MTSLDRRALLLGATAGALLPLAPPGPSYAATRTGLDRPSRKSIAMQIVSSAENSSLDWRAQYRYLEDIRDGRGTSLVARPRRSAPR